MKLLVSNRNFMILNVGFGIGLSLFNGINQTFPPPAFPPPPLLTQSPRGAVMCTALTTLIAQLVEPCGYNSVRTPARALPYLLSPNSVYTLVSACVRPTLVTSVR